MRLLVGDDGIGCSGQAHVVRRGDVGDDDVSKQEMARGSVLSLIVDNSTIPCLFVPK